MSATMGTLHPLPAMTDSDLIKFHAAALGLAVLIQAKAKGKGEAEAEVDTYQKRFLSQSVADMTRGDIHNIVERRVDKHIEGYLFRIDRLEQTAESHGVRIKQLEASQKPPEFVEKRI